MSSRKAKPRNPNPDYQDRDIKLKPLVIGLIVIALVTAGSVIGMAALLGHYRKQAAAAYPSASALAADRELPPSPLLQVAPLEELRAQQSVEGLFLNHYRWIDKEAGVARIPIERAMELLAQRGLPVREADDD